MLMNNILISLKAQTVAGGRCWSADRLTPVPAAAGQAAKLARRLLLATTTALSVALAALRAGLLTGLGRTMMSATAAVRRTLSVLAKGGSSPLEADGRARLGGVIEALQF